MGQQVQLPRILDLSAAAPIHTELSGLRGKPVELDASEVERLSGVCLQVLIAAHEAWVTDEIEFKISNPSEAFSAGVRLMAAQDFLELEQAS